MYDILRSLIKISHMLFSTWYKVPLYSFQLHSCIKGAGSTRAQTGLGHNLHVQGNGSPSPNLSILKGDFPQDRF